MSKVIAATSRSPARSCTRGASLNSNGRRTSCSVSSVGRFFMDRVTGPDLSFMNHPRKQTAQSRRQTLGRIGEIQRRLSVTPLEFRAACVRMVGDFQHSLANAETRADGKVIYMQIQIHNEVVT